MRTALQGLSAFLLAAWLPALAGPAAGPRLPESTSTLPLEGAVEVQVAEDAVRVRSAEAVPLADWKPRAEPGLWSGTMILQPLLDALRTGPPGGGDRPAGALRLAVDRDTPYGLLVRVLYTAGQAGRDPILFAVGPDGARAVAIGLPQLEAPGRGEVKVLGVRGVHGADPPPTPRLNLTLVVLRRGFMISGAGGRLEPETEADGKAGEPGAPTIGLRLGPGCQGAKTPTAACLDLARLAGTLSKIKQTFPEERRIILLAMPELRFGDLVAVMDAARGAPDHPLFPDVLLSAGME